MTNDAMTQDVAISAQPGPAPVVPARGPWNGAACAWLLAVAGWTVVLAFFDLDGGARFEPTDAWVAQTAREMYEAGEWVVPRFSGETRLQKSPGAYWAVMLASAVRGVPVDEVSVRLPNACAAVLLVAIIYWLALHIGGLRAAVYAGFAAASSTLVLYWSHRGASDIGLAAMMTLSLASLWIGSLDAQPAWRRHALWMLGYFAAGVAMLYKMPMPLACIGVPALLYVLVQRRWRIFASKWHLLGLLLFFLPWTPWVVAVIVQEPMSLEKWKVEFFDRFTGDLPSVEGQDDWRYYFFYLIPTFSLTVPYCLSVPAAVARGFRPPAEANRDGVRFLLLWFLGLFVFFTAATGKESRYFLPALPPLIVLLGMELARFFDPGRVIPAVRLRLGAAAVWVLTPAAFIGGAFALRRWQERDGVFAWAVVWPAYTVCAVIFTLGAGVAAWLFLRRRGNASFAVLVCTMWGMWLWTWAKLMPLIISQAPFVDFAQQLRERVPGELRSHLYQVAHQDPRIIWYSDVRFPRIINQLELLKQQEGVRSLETERKLVGEEMMRKLSGAEPVLLVAARDDYDAFVAAAPTLADRLGVPPPDTHLWFESRVGARKKHYLLFGNVPPP